MTLSPAEQRLVRLWREIGFGHIANVHVRSGVPTHIGRHGQRSIAVRLDANKPPATPRVLPEVADTDAEFELHALERHTLLFLRRVSAGTVSITVHDGLPTACVYEPEYEYPVRLDAFSFDLFVR